MPSSMTSPAGNVVLTTGIPSGARPEGRIYILIYCRHKVKKAIR